MSERWLLGSRTHKDNIMPEAMGIVAKQTQLLYHGFKSSAIGSMIISTALVAGLWGSIDSRTLLGWLGMMWGVLLLRGLLAHRFFQQTDIFGKTNYWNKLFSLGAAVSGSLWGVTAFLFMSPQIDSLQDVLVIFFIAGATSAGCFALAPVWSAAASFLLAAGLPLFVRLMIVHDLTHLYMSIAVLAHLLVLLRVSRNGYALLWDTMATSLENERLQKARQLERNLSEQARAESKQFLQQVIDTIADPVLVKDRQHRWVLLNRAACRLIGQPLEVLLGKSDYDFFPAEEAEVFWAKDELVFAGKESINEEVLTDADGIKHILVTHKTSFSDTYGNSFVVGSIKDITALKQAQQILAEREAEFRTLTEKIPDNIARYDSEGRMIYVNATLARAIGVEPSALIGRPLQEMLTRGIPELDAYAETLRLVLKTGEPQEIEMRVLHAEQGYQTHNIRFVAEHDEQSKIVGALAVGRDITAIKEAEAALRTSEMQFRALAEHLLDIVVRYDTECRRIYANHAYRESYYGRSTDVLGKTPTEFWMLPSPSAQEYTAILRQVMDSGETMEGLLLEIPDEEGETMHLTMALVPEFGSDGQVESVLSISHDITEIKQMETMLRKSEREFRMLAENSPEMIIRYDRDYRRVFINPAYEKYTGISLKDAWNKTPAEVWSSQMPYDQYLECLQRVMETGSPEQIMLEWYLQDGSLTSHLMHMVPEYDELGRTDGALVIGHNVSELRAIQRNLEDSRATLRSLAARRDAVREDERKSIAREIHDELGQLLYVLQLNAIAIDYHFGGMDPIVHAKATRMVEIVDRAIEVVRGLVARLRPAAFEAGLQSGLEWLVKEFSSSTDIDCSFLCAIEKVPLEEDKAMVVFRIAQESLTNVLRHSGADYVEVTLEKQDDSIVLEVRDNGNGFDPMSAIRPDSYGIVGMRERSLILKGELEITSSPGQGTVVRLRVPIGIDTDEKKNQM